MATTQLTRRAVLATERGELDGTFRARRRMPPAN